MSDLRWSEGESQVGVDGLVDLMDLETIDHNLFRGRAVETTRPRVYGGQVAAQALCSALRTVPDDLGVHSLHSYFLLPGDSTSPIVYDVEQVRDGRSFSTRRVAARQHGRTIFYLTASFQKAEEGLSHQEAMPDVPPPWEVTSFKQMLMSSGADGQAMAREWDALDIRWIGSSGRGIEADASSPSRARSWFRINGRLSDDPLEHIAAFTFASDATLLGASLAAHGERPPVQMASLDHTIWFHRPFRADEWWLYDQWSPSAHAARGLSLGRIFTQDGTLVATLAQEGLIRPMA